MFLLPNIVVLAFLDKIFVLLSIYLVRYQIFLAAILSGIIVLKIRLNCQIPRGWWVLVERGFDFRKWWWEIFINVLTALEVKY